MHLRAIQQAVRVAAPGSDPVEEIRNEAGGRFLKDLSRPTLQQWRRYDVPSIIRQGRLGPSHPAALQLRVS
ncbi:hypothetical protein RPQ02_15225 [Streptomyces sp. AM2-3-1]|uniref:hypothetical protein n=1 Tax=unclassified Streptomyces TaxID=2593676 RepID=UPI0028C39D11|nr:hypothetical protein [Streptomyces sp. AM2-3-1]WNO65064.1 hypothetical protein RPQ02_15225 [Streptomyces sp. AM2-3-1]WTI87528.1 hypothetical protein OHB17_15650 [Streptomyces sp. NBC_00724]